MLKFKTRKNWHLSVDWRMLGRRRNFRRILCRRIRSVLHL
eukprot:TCALIF_01026-PA protein Name:"Protein of unknown function" AED:0.27 eAED:0.27 QI:40/0.5/0/1/1/1/3/119/39